MSASTVGAAELKFGVFYTAHKKLQPWCQWSDSALSQFFSCAHSSWDAEGSKVLGTRRMVAEGLYSHHLPVLRSLQGWVYRAGHGSSPTMWASPEVPSHPPMPKSSMNFRDPDSPLLPSDPQEILGASLLFYSWDHKNFLAHPILTPDSCFPQVGSRAIMRTRSQTKLEKSNLSLPYLWAPLHFNHAF